MSNVPFLASFAEKTKSVPLRGRYNRETQTLVQSSPRGFGKVVATMPTHVETDTGGYNDTDTGTTED